jgi:integrase
MFEGTKKDADAALREWLRELETGYPFTPEKLTVGEHLRRWLERHGKNLRRRTLDSYRMIVERHLIPALGHISLVKLHPAHIEDYHQQKLAVLSPRTVQYHHRVLSKALKYAVKLRLITYNPARDIEPPSPAKRPPMVLLPEQGARLLEVAAGHRDYTLILVVLHTGLRRSELLALRWKDVDLNNRVLHVEETLHRSRGELYFDVPKSAKGRRLVPLTRAAAAVLREHRKAQLEQRLMLGQKYQDNGLVFCNPNGTPLSPDGISGRFKTLARKIGMPQLRFHDLRHTWASWVAAAGIEPKILQEWAGHAVVSFTLDTYVQALPKHVLAAADRLEQFLVAQQLPNSTQTKPIPSE